MENRKTMGFRIEDKDFSWIFQLELLYESIRVYFQGLFDKTSVLSRSTKNNSRRLRVFECSGNCCMIEWMCNSVTKMFLMYPNVAYVVWDCNERASGVSQANYFHGTGREEQGKQAGRRMKMTRPAASAMQVQPGLSLRIQLMK